MIAVIKENMKNYDFDLDGDHTVSREELQVAVEKNCKRSISLAEIEGILSKADLNQSGALDFGEFLGQIFNINRYGTVWCFKGNANSRARISVEK